jgi:hypothetical protein
MEALEVKEEAEGGAECGLKVDDNVVNGRMLTMAGLFDICQLEESEVSGQTYSYNCHFFSYVFGQGALCTEMKAMVAMLDFPPPLLA